MSRFLFFLFLIANLALAGYVYVYASRPAGGAPVEVNRDNMKVLSITDSAKAQKDAADAKKLVQSLVGASCLQFSVKPADAPRAQTAFSAMVLGERISSRNVEEFTRWGVVLPAQKDRKAADTLITNLKKANVKDVSLMADNGVSLGLFSSEEAARRVLSELETKNASLVKGIAVIAKSPVVKETLFTVREPDPTLIARVAVLQKDFEASAMKGVDCPASTTTAAVVAPSTATADAKAAPKTETKNTPAKK
jgi:hypothetical protein